MKRAPFACAAALLCSLSALKAGQVVITEIHYNPEGDQPEFLEVANLTPRVFDIAEWKLKGGVSFELPPFDEGNPRSSFLKARERVLFAGVQEATLRAAYPSIPEDVRIFGPWSGNLSNGGESVVLEDKNGFRVAEVSYGDGGDQWPVAPDGTATIGSEKTMRPATTTWVCPRSPSIRMITATR